MSADGRRWRGSAVFAAAVREETGEEIKDSRVRQLCQRGMPHEKDGTVSVFDEASLEWYRKNGGRAARRAGKGGTRPGAGRPKKGAKGSATGGQPSGISHSASGKTGGRGDPHPPAAGARRHPLPGGEGGETVAATDESGRRVEVSLTEAQRMLGEEFSPADLYTLSLTDIEKIARCAVAYQAWQSAKEKDGSLVDVEAATREWGAACSAMTNALRDSMRAAVDAMVRAGIVEAAESAAALETVNTHAEDALRRLATETFGGGSGEAVKR